MLCHYNPSRQYQQKGRRGRRKLPRRTDRGMEVPFMLNDQNPAQILKKGQPEDIALGEAQKYSISWFSLSSVRINHKLIVNSRLQSYLPPVESSTFRWTSLQPGNLVKV